jgi:hypothetical protein
MFRLGFLFHLWEFDQKVKAQAMHRPGLMSNELDFSELGMVYAPAFEVRSGATKSNPGEASPGL